jgi:hypothetical protein
MLQASFIFELVALRLVMVVEKVLVAVESFGGGDFVRS